MLLFALPIVGWLICIIMAFAPKNKSLKNYARANLIWLLIGVILAILLGIAAMTLGNLVADLFQGFSLGFNLEEIFGIGDISGIGELSGIEDISGLEDILGQIGELEGQIPVE